MGRLYNKLQDNANSDIYPFHMPGHKRNLNDFNNPYSYDITEVDGFDDLHDAHDIIDDINKRAAILYGCDKALIMTNGSTGGVLTAVSAVLDQGETILVAGNSHKSAYNSVILRNLKTEFIYPQQDGELGINQAISPIEVEKKLLSNPQIKAVFITSPTYEGVISDIEEIARIAHDNKVALIVDAAHGAHLGFDTKFEKNPASLGADIVIMSLHKTLPTLTQSAILCYNSGLVDYDKIKKYFDIYITSSPSYLMMASIERCFDMLEKDVDKIFNTYYSNLHSFYINMKKLKKLYIYRPEGRFDYGKIVIAVNHSNINGIQLKDILLKEYKIQIEMASNEYVIAMTSIRDTEIGFTRLEKALIEIDSKLKKDYRKLVIDIPDNNFSIGCLDSNSELIDILEAEGCVSCEYIYMYPPGIPIVMPGTVFTRCITEYIMKSKNDGLNIAGITSDNCVRVVRR